MDKSVSRNHLASMVFLSNPAILIYNVLYGRVSPFSKTREIIKMTNDATFTPSGGHSSKVMQNNCP